MEKSPKKLKSKYRAIEYSCFAGEFVSVAAPFVAAKYIENGCFDYAGFGRMIFAYPDFAKAILNHGELDKNKICICCSKCTELMRSGTTPGCVVRDKIYTELYKEFKNKRV